MAEHKNPSRHYSRAPIAEALIDIRVRLPSDISLETMAEVGAAEEGYPEKKRRGEVHWELTTGSSGGSSGISTSASEIPLGYMFASNDGQRAFQARLNGFTFSWLGKYESWQALRTEARRLWNVYRSIGRPEAVTRIAVRYINRLELPLPFDDFKDYLRTLPELSTDMSDGLSSYFMQLQIPQIDLKALLILNEALLPQTKPEIVPVLLDVDLFREENMIDDEDAMWDLFEAFRERKNQIFEACITDKMRGLII